MLEKAGKPQYSLILLSGVVRHDENAAIVRRSHLFIAVDGEAYGSTLTLPNEWDRPLFVQLVATGPNGPVVILSSPA